MSMYVNSAGTATCNPGTRQEQSSVGSFVSNVTTAEPCAQFYLAQVSAAYAGKQMQVLLFDPGEGATAITLLQPNGTAATVSYQSADLSPNLEGPSSGASAFSGTGTCICNTDLKQTQLAGRESPSEYNDRFILITTTIPSGAALSANGGWYQVQYTFNGSAITDRTTWSVNIIGDPVHLAQ